MVRAIDRKLLRDLAALRGQVATIALVVACGIASYVTLQSTWASLQRSVTAFYLDYRFGDVFVHLKRAPESVRDRLEEIPGVALVYTRVVEGVTLPLAGQARAEEGSRNTGGETGENLLITCHRRASARPSIAARSMNRRRTSALRGAWPPTSLLK